jgi:hypothetical protein
VAALGALRHDSDRPRPAGADTRSPEVGRQLRARLEWEIEWGKASHMVAVDPLQNGGWSGRIRREGDLARVRPHG